MAARARDVGIVLTCIAALPAYVFFRRFSDGHDANNPVVWGYAVVAILFLILGPVLFMRNKGGER